MAAQRSRFSLAQLGSYAVRGAALVAVAMIAVVVVTSSDETWAQLTAFERWTLPVAALMVLTAWLCNGARTLIMARALGHPLRYRQAIGITLSTEFGIAASPGGVGGTIIRITFLRRAGVPVPTAFSMLAADVSADLAFFAVLTPLVALYVLKGHMWANLVDEFRPGAALLPLMALALIALLAVRIWRRGGWKHRCQRWAGAFAWGRKRRLPGRLRLIWRNMARSLRDMAGVTRFLLAQRRRALLLNFALASVQWLCRYGVLPLLLYGFGTTMNPLPLLLIQGFLFFISLAIVLPGGGGGVEVLTAIILPFFVPLAQVPLVVLLWRFFTYYLYLLGGGIVFFIASRANDRIFRLGDRHHPTWHMEPS